MESEEGLLIEKTANYIREKFEGEGSGHDWWHIYRVWQNALLIAKEEKADLVLVQLAALLHDVADWKFHEGDEKKGPQIATSWLESLGVESGVISSVCDIIETVSYKGSGVADKMKNIEGKIVQDADRLDAIGAIGIARTFAYGGFKGRPLYDPDVKPDQHNSFEEYKKNAGPTVNHFYEKLLLLKDRMHTKTAKLIAEERHKYMEDFLERFYAEWEGTDLLTHAK